MALPCPCCGYLTLTEAVAYEICPVCCWEDDGQDDPRADEVWGGPNGRLSLTAARENFRRISAKSLRCFTSGEEWRRADLMRAWPPRWA